MEALKITVHFRGSQLVNFDKLFFFGFLQILLFEIKLARNRRLRFMCHYFVCMSNQIVTREIRKLDHWAFQIQSIPFYYLLTNYAYNTGV